MGVRYAMSAPAVTMPMMASAQEAAQHMQHSGVGAVFAVDDNHLLGVVTDRDLTTRVLVPGL
ncbi:CBS domain-containing protein [Streptomyces rimosus]|uniref:CBS domain-containing protein n=1 Tax=Streptomyces rimosus TaxID=1927 RepID=UPI0006B26F33|nr:CBS domain-containing protein [Streptomyces rimosus]